MVYAEYMDRIKRSLGWPVLEIELPDKDIEELIKNAFFELKPYIDTPFFKTFTISGSTLNLKGENVKAILYVMRGKYNTVSAQMNSDALLFNPLNTLLTQYTNINGGYSTQTLMSGYTTNLLYQQIRNTLNQDLDYHYDPNTEILYLYQQVPTSSEITLVYNKVLKDIKEIQDDYWVNHMLKLSMAYVKLVIGRIRSKYTPVSAPYELDGDTLVQEAQQELQEIRQFLRDNDNLFIPLD